MSAWIEEHEADVTPPPPGRSPLDAGPGRPSRVQPAAEQAGGDALAELFRSAHEPAVRFAYVLTGSSTAADDLVDDAFAQLVRRWSDVREPRAYLYQAIVSGARSWGRRKARTYALDPRPPIDVDTDAFVVRAVLATLPRPQREALVLRYFAGMTDPEVAAAMDLPLGTAKSHLRRGIDAMRKELT